MDGKVFSDETKDLLVDVIDDAIKLPFWAEPFDGIGIKWLIEFIDKSGDKVIPDNLDCMINDCLVLGVNGNYDEAADELSKAVNTVVDIPLMDEDSEQKLFTNIILVLLSFIEIWIKKKKEKN